MSCTHDNFDEYFMTCPDCHMTEDELHTCGRDPLMVVSLPCEFCEFNKSLED